MTGSTHVVTRDFSPRALDAGGDRLLDPDHPFLRVGTWRAFVADDGNVSVRLVASVDPRQEIAAGPVGAIGFFLAGGSGLASGPAPASGRPVGSRVEPLILAGLAQAERWLRANGAAAIRCPVRFSTWYGHRLMTAGLPARGGSARFPLEPDDCPGLADALAGAGFVVAHTAGSYLVDTERWIAEAGRSVGLMQAAGLVDRPIRPDRVDDELHALHAISSAAFTRSWGFSGITFDEFASIYRPLIPLTDPELVRVMEARGGEPVGYVFAYADPAVPAGSPGARFVAKTIAVLPEVGRVAPGAGTELAVVVHRIAAARGYRTAIHACVADGAYTQRVSARWGERFRSYATYEKALR